MTPGFASQFRFHLAAGRAAPVAGAPLIGFDNASPKLLSLVAYLPEQVGYSGSDQSPGLQAGPENASRVQSVNSQSAVFLHQRPAGVVANVVPQASGHRGAGRVLSSGQFLPKARHAQLHSVLTVNDIKNRGDEPIRMVQRQALNQGKRQ